MFTKYRNDADFSESIKNTDDLKEILKSNGIIKETDNTNRTYTNYVIPYLYRKFLQVSLNNSDLDRFHKSKQKD